MTWQVITAACATVIAGAASPMFVIPWLKRGNHYDVPVARSSHRVAVPRGGGLAMVSAAIVGVTILCVLEAAGYNARLSGRFWPLVAIPFAMSALGFAEDTRGLGIRTRLLGQLTVGAVGAVWLLATDHRALLWAALLTLVLAGYVNIANFMDGVNGISGLHGTIAGATFLLIGNGVHDTALQLAAVLLATASLAFLPWNAPKARIFLGDCGSYFIGAAVATLAVTAIQSGATFELAVAPAAVYVVDTMWTMGSRYRRGEPVHESHCSHVYQRLTDFGLSHVQSSGVVATATVVVISLASVSTVGELVPRVLADALAALVLTGYLALPALLRVRRAAQRPSTVDH